MISRTRKAATFKFMKLDVLTERLGFKLPPFLKNCGVNSFGP